MEDRRLRKRIEVAPEKIPSAGPQIEARKIKKLRKSSRLLFKTKRRGEKQKPCESSYKIGLGLRGPFPHRMRGTLAIQNEELDAKFIVVDIKQEGEHVLLKLGDVEKESFAWVDHFEFWRLKNALKALVEYWPKGGEKKWSHYDICPGVESFLQAFMRVRDDKEDHNMPMILSKSDQYDEEGNSTRDIVE